jgi:predicted ATPase/DNA-binding SARP family transcriptional activator
MQPIEIHLLGEFNLQISGRSLPAFNADRPQTLLAYLLLHRHAPQSRRHLAFLLWPDSTEAQALSNLRYLLHTLRQALPDADSYLAVDKLTLQWRPQLPYRLDVADFEDALRAAQQTADPHTARRWLEQAVSHYLGDLLPANYDDWLIPLRDDMARRYQAALVQLIDLLTEAGAYQSAANYAQQLAQQDPLNESHTIRLMRLYALAGERSAVRRVYQQCVALLAQELGVEPEAATQAAYEVAMAQAAPSAPIPTLAAPTPRPLPQPPTPFLGREVELHEIGRLLADPHCRLLTITGPGGMGKTRLALQTAVSQQPHFRDGVVYVSLRPLNSVDFLAATIASALNLTLAGQPDTRSQLLHLLARREMLIFLDNFEHLLDGVDLITDILAQAGGIKLLVTSRQRLDLQEEWSFALGEFNLPAAPTAEEMENSSAVALFVQSARRADSSFNLTPADYEAVARICRLVGGLPLGIELAASWARLLSCAEIAQEIEQGLDFLTVSTRNMPAQHQNLRAVFDQSWALLTPAEQRLLQALTIFQGSFTRSAAAEVAEATLPLLSGLIDKSLLRRLGPDRYSLHELIRQYATERLQADRAVYQEVGAKHGRFFLNWLAGSETDLFSHLRGPVFEQLTASVGDLRAAWKWGLAQQQWDLLLRAARTYPTFYELHSWNQEGLRLLSAATGRLQQAMSQLPEGSEPPESLLLLLGAMMGSRGWFHFRCGQMAEARAVLDQGLTHIRAAGPHTEAERCLQFALFQLGMVAYISGDYATAQSVLDEGLAISRPLSDDWGTAYTLAILGMVRLAQGQAAQAYELLAESLATWRRNGSPRLGVFCFSFFGIVARVTGKHEEAESALQEGLTLAQNAGDRYGVATFLHSLAALKLAQTEYEAAATAVQDSLAIFTELGDRWRITQGQTLSAAILLAQGDLAGSETAYRDAFATAVDAHALPYALEALLGLADLYAQTEQKTAAFVLAQRVQNHPASSGPVQARAARLVEQLEQNGLENTAVAPSVAKLLTYIDS